MSNDSVGLPRVVAEYNPKPRTVTVTDISKDVQFQYTTTANVIQVEMTDDNVSITLNDTQANFEEMRMQFVLAAPSETLIQSWNDYAEECGNGMIEIYNQWRAFHKTIRIPSVFEDLVDSIMYMEEMNTFEKWESMKNSIFSMPRNFIRVIGTETIDSEEWTQDLTLNLAVLKLIKMNWIRYFYASETTAKIDGYTGYQDDLVTIAEINDQIGKIEIILAKQEGGASQWKFNGY